MADFLTIAEAVQFTGKSRRTLTRLAIRLTQINPDQVMREKTARGYIWRISRQRLQAEYGVTSLPANPLAAQESTPAPLSIPVDMSQALQIASQGYAGLLALHQEVKQLYQEQLQEKEERIAALTQELTQAKKGFWAWLWGR